MPQIDLGSVVGPQGAQGIQGPQGIQGEQGIPGPNQVTAATSTTLIGILYGNGSKVSARSLDSSPPLGSNKLGSSNGVANALLFKSSYMPFEIPVGKKLVITIGGGNYSEVFGLIIMTSGAALTQNACYMVSGLGDRPGYHSVNTIYAQPTPSVSITDNGGTIEVSNSHGSYTMRAGMIIVLDSAEQLSFSVV